MDLRHSPNQLGEATVSNNITKLQQEIRKWADGLIPDRTADQAMAKLMNEELPELIASGSMDALEFADVVILIFDVAYLRGIDIGTAVQRKMEINRKRQWRVNETGVMKHVKDTD